MHSSFCVSDSKNKQLKLAIYDILLEFNSTTNTMIYAKTTYKNPNDNMDQDLFFRTINFIFLQPFYNNFTAIEYTTSIYMKGVLCKNFF